MKSKCMLAVLLITLLFTYVATAEEHDYYQNHRFRPKLVPGVGLDQIEQEGGPDTTDYLRRTVKWWPRKGQDIVDIPEGVPLRTWTRNKGQVDKEALAGVCRNWTESDPDTFKAHLIGFRGIGVPTPNPTFSDDVLIPAAILRMENGERRLVVHHSPFSLMLSPEDHDFILEKWKEEWPKLTAPLSKQEYVTNPHLAESWPSNHPGYCVLESEHWRFQTGGTTWVDDYYLLSPGQPEKQARYRKGTLEFAEGLWDYVEAAGGRMPFWREGGPFHKFAVTTGPGIKNGWERLDPGNGGGYGCCTVYWSGGGPRAIKLAHEFGHSGFHGENGCNAMIHTMIPGELRMFSHNFCYPWRNVMFADYQAGLWMIALGDNPNWGSGIVPVLGSLRSGAEPTLYHVAARLGQKKGLWKNGIKGFGDFFGEYAARMVTVDFVGQYAMRCKYGMPEISCVYPVYGSENTYRVSNSEAPRAYGFNIIRLDPDDDVKEGDAKEITIDVRGFHNPERHSDWRACIVAVDGKGRARYSPLWNKGKMTFPLKPSDKHLWMSVAATPSAMPVRGGAGWYHSMDNYFHGNRAPRFPWEVALTGCKPGTPHRRQGDVVNLDELYTFSNSNFWLDHGVRHEVPLPTWDADAELAQEKLAAMLPRIKGATEAVNKRLAAGNGFDEYWLKDWCEYRKLERLEDLEQRVKFLQRNAKGHRHSNGGGFVSDNCKVAPTAYVGPNAMVLDGATVDGNACIKEFGVVIGPKAVVSGNAKIGGRAWVYGNIKVDGNARIIESPLLTTDYRFRGGYHVKSDRYNEGEAHITGNAVIKGEHIMQLCYTPDQVITGGVVVDYTAKISNHAKGVTSSGRFCEGGSYNWAWTPRASLGQNLSNGADSGELYANWEFDYPKVYMLEDSYVNNNGILHGNPNFSSDGDRKCAAFNGTNQYAEAPSSVADFGELTIDMAINWSGGKDQRIFDFGTGEDECFYLSVSDKSGKPSLVAVHGGKTHRLTATEAVPANQWVVVRVELNGSNAAIYVDGKQIAKDAFPFRPRDVFIGDKAEGNFIACDRNKAGFFKGRIDHFRIYRKTHKDFHAIGKPDPNVHQLAIEWTKRQAAKQKEIAENSPFKNFGKESEELNRRRSQLLNTSAKLTELNEKQGVASKRKSEIDRDVQEKFNALETTAATNKEIGEIRQNIEQINRELRESGEYATATGAIQKLEQAIRDIDRKVRESEEVTALAEKARAEEEKRRKIEEAIRELPEMKKALEAHHNEKDNQKRDELRRKYDSMFQEKRATSVEYSAAETMRREFENQHQRMIDERLAANLERTKAAGKLESLRRNQPRIMEKARANHPKLAKLEETLQQKQRRFEETKREFLTNEPKTGELGDEYNKLVAELDAISRAIPEERARLLKANEKELAKIGARLYEMGYQRKHWRYDGAYLAMKKAGLGRNPLHIGKEPSILSLHEKVDYRTSADWEYRTSQEIEGKVPPIMKEWLDRVRGY